MCSNFRRALDLHDWASANRRQIHTRRAAETILSVQFFTNRPVTPIWKPGSISVQMAPDDTTVGRTPLSREHFKAGARKSRGVFHLIGWPRNGTRFSARSLLCPRLDLGDPPDALAALSRTIRKHPGRSSRPLADRLKATRQLFGRSWPIFSALRVTLQNLIIAPAAGSDG